MTSYKEKIAVQSYIESEMIEAAFEYWFSDHEHVRSPFPEYIREELKTQSAGSFLDWASKLTDKAKKDINDEILAEKLEEIIFEKALDMVKTEDEKITIKFPFLLRLNDTVKVKDVNEHIAESIVIERELIKEGDTVYLFVRLRNLASGMEWDTKFELPE